jgi:SHS2 domain-containing protein
VTFIVTGYTADIGLTIESGSIEELFRDAFYGLLEIAAEKEKMGDVVEQKTVGIKAEDSEALLVDFLNEVIYLIYCSRWLPSSIEELEISDNKLKAVISGYAYESPELIKTEVKAATYHGLKITKSGDKWKTKLLFDV